MRKFLVSIFLALLSAAAFADGLAENVRLLAGNWKIEMFDSEGSLVRETRMAVYPPKKVVCETQGEGVCVWRSIPDPEGDWSAGYEGEGYGYYVQKFEVGPGGQVNIDHSYGIIGHWGASSELSFSDNRGQGNWRYGDDGGSEVWSRIPATLTSSFFAEINTKAEDRRGTQQAADVAGSVGGQLAPGDMAPHLTSSAWRPYFYFEVAGENLSGFHHTEIHSPGLHLNGCVPVAGSGDEERLACEVVLWPGAANGKHTFLFDDIEVPFELKIAGLGEPEDDDAVVDLAMSASVVPAEEYPAVQPLVDLSPGTYFIRVEVANVGDEDVGGYSLQPNLSAEQGVNIVDGVSVLACPSEDDLGCQPCELSEERYTCPYALPSGERTNLYYALTAKETKAENDDPQTCGQPLQLQQEVVPTGDSEDRDQSNNTDQLAVQPFSYLVDTIEVLGVVTDPEGNESKNFPVQSLVQGGQFKFKVNLMEGACQQPTQMVVKHVYSSLHVGWQTVELEPNPAGNALLHKGAPWIATYGGTKYAYAFGPIRDEIAVTPFPSAFMQIRSVPDNGRDHRVIRAGQDYQIDVTSIDVIPENVVSLPFELHFDEADIGGFDRSITISRASESRFSLTSPLPSDAPEEGAVILVADYAFESSIKASYDGAQIIDIVPDEIDLYDLERLYFRDAITNQLIDAASFDDAVVLEGMYSDSAPEESVFRVAGEGGEIQNFVGKRDESGKRLVSSPIELTHFSEAPINSKLILGLEDETLQSALQIIGREGRASRVYFLQDDAEVDAIDVNKAFRVVAEFEQLPTDESTRLDLRIIQPGVGGDVRRSVELSKDASINTMSAAQQPLADTAIPGDVIAIAFDEVAARANVVDASSADTEVTIRATDGFGQALSAKVRLTSDKATVRGVTNRPLKLNYGAYRLDMDVAGCCTYRSTVDISATSSAQIVVPQLAYVSVAPGDTPRSFLQEGQLKLTLQGKASDGFTASVFTWTRQLPRGVNVPPGQYLTQVALPSIGFEQVGERRAASGQNNIALNVGMPTINVLDSKGNTLTGTVQVGRQSFPLSKPFPAGDPGRRAVIKPTGVKGLLRTYDVAIDRNSGDRTIRLSSYTPAPERLKYFRAESATLNSMSISPGATYELMPGSYTVVWSGRKAAAPTGLGASRNTGGALRKFRSTFRVTDDGSIIGVSEWRRVYGFR